MRIALLAILLVCVQAESMAQSINRKKNRGIFPTFGNYDKKGWVFSPLFTYTLPPFSNASETIPINDAQSYEVDYTAVGRIGLGVEAGRFYAVETSRLINYYDFTLGFKNIRGVERYSATLVDSNGAGSNIAEGEGVFALNYITASFNIHKMNQISNTTFIQNSLGVNVDYNISENATYNDRGIPLDPVDTDPLLAQIHYRFGVGIKIAPNVMMIPSLETAILTVYEFDDFKSTLPVFNSRYRPVIGRVSFLLLDKKADRECPSNGKRKKGKSETLFGK